MSVCHVAGIENEPLTVKVQATGVDAFGRLRVSNPEYVFDAQLTYDLQPLLFEQVTAQSGATVAHDSTNRCALMTFASTPTGGAAYMQSYGAGDGHWRHV